MQQWLKTTLKDEDVNCKRGGKHDSNDFEVSNGTALHWAAYYGRMEIAKLLIGKRASMLMIIAVYKPTKTSNIHVHFLSF